MRQRFVELVKENPSASAFFSSLSVKDMFLSEAADLRREIDKLRNIPSELVDTRSGSGMSLLAMYLICCLPESPSDEYIQIFFHAVDVLLARDLDFVVGAVAPKLTLQQKEMSIFYLPDCGSTFRFLGTMLDDSDAVFLNAYQRTFSSFHLVPKCCRAEVKANLTKSLKFGPARFHVLEMLEIAIGHSKPEDDDDACVFLILMNCIVDSFPESMETLTRDETVEFFKAILAQPLLPRSVLWLMIKTRVNLDLKFPQMVSFLSICPALLFEYFSTLMEDEKVGAWYLLLVKGRHEIKDMFDTLTVFSNFFAAIKSDPNLLAVVVPSEFLEWSASLISRMTGRKEELAVFGIYLLFVRCFDEIARKVVETTQVVAACDQLIHKAEDKIELADVIFWSLDPSRKCSFKELVDVRDDIFADIPPPSSAFVFQIVPCLLNVLIPVAIEESTPKECLKERTPVRLIAKQESTHTQVKLVLDDADLLLGDDEEAIKDLSTRFVDDGASVCTGKMDDLVVEPFLAFLVETLTAMYDKEELLAFLYCISSSIILLPLLPFVNGNTACYKFFVRALGLSCPFPVFEAYFAQINSDIQKTIQFLSSLAEYSQLVSDFLYVTSEIPLAIGSPVSSIVVWLRPLSLSRVLTLRDSKNGDFWIGADKSRIRFSNGKEIEMPPKIGGWIMLCISYRDSSSISVSVNLSTPVKVTNVDLQACSRVVVGDQHAHFDLQSVRMFRTVLTETDLLYLFAIGPNYKEFMLSGFDAISSGTPPAYVSDNGFISHLYLPFVHKYAVDKKIESKCFNDMEISLSPPFRTVRHLTKNPPKQPMMISVDKRRSCLFLNSLHCHGGMHLLIHYIGEVILKQNELNLPLWTMFDKLLNYHPTVNQFFETKHVYALVGHLMWSGNVNVDDTIHLAMRELDGKCYLTNPRIIEHWLLKAQVSYFEMPDLIVKLMGSLESRHNFAILQKIHTFEKIVDVLCGKSSHSSQFLCLLGDFAVQLVNAQNADAKAKLVFDNLMLHHFRFAENQHCTLAPLNTIHLLRLLGLILFSFNDVNVELELFIPAIVSAIPMVQVAIITLLVRHMSADYLYPLANVMKKLPYLEDLKTSLYAMVYTNISRITYGRMITCLLYMCSHEESTADCEKLCSLVPGVSVANEPISGGLVILLQAIKIVETNDKLRHFDSSEIIGNFISSFLFAGVEANSLDLSHFLVVLFTTPCVSFYRLASLSLFLMNKIAESLIQRQLPLGSLEKSVEDLCVFGAYVIHKVRLTPGAIDDALMDLLKSFTERIVSLATHLTTPEGAQSLVTFLIALCHLELPHQFISTIKSRIEEIPKVTKQKRYPELSERMDSPWMLTPAKFEVPFEALMEQCDAKWQTIDEEDRIALFSLACRSIHHQTKVTMIYNTTDPESDEIIVLWDNIFKVLQCPGSGIYKDCPPKWKVSDRASNFQQRVIMLPMNPSIDSNYVSYWNAKYGKSSCPNIRLKLREVLQFTPISLHNANDVKFSSHAIRISGISNYDGVFVVTDTKIRFYQQAKKEHSIESSKFCEDYVTISLPKIVSVKLKSFRHQPTGIEITTSDYTCYIFAFDTGNLRDSFIDLMSSMGVQVVRTVNARELENAAKRWIDGSMSNFEYLLYLNNVSGRSWIDFTQYPIVPWVLSCYLSDTLNLDDPECYRDLKLPIFAQTEAQQEQCTVYYETTRVMGSDAHCNPNYISNVGSTLYFLVRAEPFTDEEVVFQNGCLDSADRTFQSFGISYALMTSPGNKSALELVPEFYYNPEVLKNVNSIVFPESPITKRVVGDVVLPKWASSHRDFIMKMRMALESPIVSRQLHEWIDLIWGFRRRGEPARERFNIFQHTVFEFDPSEVIDDRLLFKAIKDQIQNCGQASQALFKLPHPKRQEAKIREELTGELVFVNVKKPTQAERLLFKDAFQGDPWVPVPSGSTSISAVRLSFGCLEARIGNVIEPKLCFSGETEITCFDLMGVTIVTGHLMPIVNLWKMKGSNIHQITSLRCHLSQVTSVSFFGKDWTMVAAGHDDGYVSLFSTNPVRFLRALEPPLDSPVTLLRASVSSGDLLVVQSHTVSLWSINGELVSSVRMETSVIDAVFTNYEEGTHVNFVFLLCTDHHIFTLSAFDLNITNEIPVTRPNPTTLSLSRDGKMLLCAHADGQMTTWRIH